MNKGSRDLGWGALCYRGAASDGDRLKVSYGGSRKGSLNPGGILGPGHCFAASGTCSPSRLPGGLDSLWHFSPTELRTLKLNLDCDTLLDLNKPWYWVFDQTGLFSLKL